MKRLSHATRADLPNLVRGYLMGAADVVPGVSGGTVALVLGIYERLVHAIRTGAAALGAAVRGRFGDAAGHLRAVDWRFLLILLTGILLAVVSLAQLIEYFLDEEPQNTAAVFFGLVLGSIVVAWPRVGTWTPQNIVSGLVVAGAAFLVLGLRSDEITSPDTILFFGAGAVAIVAMILPGISGSFILLMLGMYEAVLDAVNDRDLAILGVFLIGAVIGLALFSTLLDRLLRDHHDAVMAMLIGLMTGSLRVLWPWPDGTDNAKLGAPDDALVPVILAVVGLAVVLAIGQSGKRQTLSAGHERE
jgi:putative membrane protein